MVGSQVGSMNGVDFGSCNLVDEANADVEPVPREMKGREAIRIVDLYKSFHACNKPEMKAVNGKCKPFLLYYVQILIVRIFFRHKSNHL
jgi:hypothetical protein